MWQTKDQAPEQEHFECMGNQVGWEARWQEQAGFWADVRLGSVGGGRDGAPRQVRLVIVDVNLAFNLTWLLP
jgi:hypothetical protein